MPKKGFFKKALLVVLLGGAALVIAGWFTREPIKRMASKHPALKSVLMKVAEQVRSFRYARSSLGRLPRNETLTEASLVVDFSQELGTYRKFWQGLGQDSFNAGFFERHNRAYYEMLGSMNRQRPVFRYVHSKGMLCDRYHEKREDTCGHVYTRDASGGLRYNWAIADRVYDFMLENGMTPLVSLTYMPSALAADPKNRNPWNRANISPPKDYEPWRDLIFQTVQHLKMRYGEETLRDWYVEVWNEPDLPQFFWKYHPDRERYPNKGDKIAYFKLYDYAAAGAMAAFPDVRIGGPAIAGDIDFFINDWLPHCLDGTNYATGERGTRVTFLSRHVYGSVMDKLLPNIKLFMDKAKANGGPIAERADFLITEFGPTAFPKPWLNTRYVAAWLVKAVDGIFYLGDHEGPEYVPDAMFFWTKPVPPNFDKHFGLVTALGHPRNPSPRAMVKRPVFNAFDALARLGDTRVAVEGTQFGDAIHALATKDERSLQVLVYHLREYDYENTDTGRFPVDITIQNLPFEKFRVELYLIDESHSNGYTVWKELGEPQYPNPEQLRRLQESDDLARVAADTGTVNEDGSYQQSLDLQNNSVALLVLTEATEAATYNVR